MHPGIRSRFFTAFLLLMFAVSVGTGCGPNYDGSGPSDTGEMDGTGDTDIADDGIIDLIVDGGDMAPDGDDPSVEPTDQGEDGTLDTEDVPDPLPDIFDLRVANVVTVDTNRSVGAREVVFSIHLAQIPVCELEADGLTFGFLLDSDRDAGTGQTGGLFDGLGVDARVSARCDGSSGLFESPIGTVSLEPEDDGSADINIRTRVDRLPSTDFYWVAYATDGQRATRLPAAPEVSRWAIIEHLLHY